MSQRPFCLSQVNRSLERRMHVSEYASEKVERTVYVVDCLLLLQLCYITVCIGKIKIGFKYTVHCLIATETHKKPTIASELVTYRVLKSPL